MKLDSLNQTSSCRPKGDSKKVRTSRRETRLSANLLITLLSVASTTSCRALLISRVLRQGPAATTSLFSPGNCLAAFGIYSNPVSRKILSRTTRSWYRHGDSYDSQERKKEHENATKLYLEVQDEETLSSSAVPAHDENDEGDEKQENMDRYLEFLDRRYNRLHSEDDDVSPPKQDEKGGGGGGGGGATMMNTAWNWLFESSDEADDPSDFTKMQDDALYILGVAELASERLLQKHHLKMQNQVVALETVVEDPSLRSVETVSKYSGTSLTKRVFRKLRAYRKVLTKSIKSERANLFRKFVVGWGCTVRALRKPKYCAFSLLGIITVFFLAAVTNIMMQF